ncbi:MAG: hypothetical protein EKK48_28475 [Candidatus Melainabacteria bacterium]|nr:MAG: hypothetical protein EKK48_28475 [Candidatus Melainabacteria bacterium]
MNKSLTAFALFATFALAVGRVNANTMYGEVQRAKTIPPNQVGPRVVWNISAEQPVVRLSSDQPTFGAAAILGSADFALIMPGTGAPFPDSAYLDVEMDRYLNPGSEFAPPLVSVEFFAPATKIYSYESAAFNSSLLKVETGTYQPVSVRIIIPSGLMITRVAIVAKANGNTTSDFSARNIRFNGKAADKINVNLLNDKHAIDRLINVVRHSNK